MIDMELKGQGENRGAITAAGGIHSNPRKALRFISKRCSHYGDLGGCGGLNSLYLDAPGRSTEKLSSRQHLVPC